MTLLLPRSTPSLAGVAWLADPRLHRLFAAIEEQDDTAWVVGGAVRNTLLGLPVTDVDVATTATPDVVTARALAHGLKPVPTGIDHGTVTVVVEGHPFEVTTLRRDVETDGRRAVVAFGRDWSADAHRRDFTMNALYASLDGVVHDFVGGLEDCRAGRVRFIGDPARRIAEDRLRILRFFRFHAAYGRGLLDAEGVRAVVAARDGLADLSAERVGQEVMKLVVAAGAPATVAAMSDAGLVERTLGRAVDLAGFSGLHRLAATGAVARVAAEAPLFLAALAAWSEDDALDLASRLRLSNTARDRMATATRLARGIDSGCDAAAVRRLVHAEGRIAACDALSLGVARGRLACEPAADLLALARHWPVPRLPIGARDLIARGFSPGPGLGAALKRVEAAWVASDFTASAADLLATIVDNSIR